MTTKRIRFPTSDGKVGSIALLLREPTTDVPASLAEADIAKPELAEENGRQLIANASPKRMTRRRLDS